MTQTALKLSDLTFEALYNAEFRLCEGNPIIRRHGFSTVVADPFVLTPDLTPDGRWKLFAHTLEGVFLYDSADGLSFGKGRKILARAMRPCVAKTGEGYILYYERVQPLLARGLTMLGADWKSEIWAVRSRDLVTFSEPFPVLSYDRPYEQAGRRGHSLSNPFVIEDGGGWSLYYSAGLTFVPDCGFSEPTFVCLAKSDRPDAGFVKGDAPVIRPDPDIRFSTSAPAVSKSTVSPIAMPASRTASTAWERGASPPSVFCAPRTACISSSRAPSSPPPATEVGCHSSSMPPTSSPHPTAPSAFTSTPATAPTSSASNTSEWGNYSPARVLHPRAPKLLSNVNKMLLCVKRNNS